MARLWTDPEYRARMSAQMKARWLTLPIGSAPAAPTSTNAPYRWQHVRSRRIAFQAKLEMREHTACGLIRSTAS